MRSLAATAALLVLLQTAGAATVSQQVPENAAPAPTPAAQTPPQAARATTPAEPTAAQAAAALKDAEREAITVTRYDLDLHVRPAESRLNAVARLRLRNDGKTPLSHIALERLVDAGVGGDLRPGCRWHLGKSCRSSITGWTPIRTTRARRTRR